MNDFAMPAGPVLFVAKSPIYSNCEPIKCGNITINPLGTERSLSSRLR